MKTSFRFFSLMIVFVLLFSAVGAVKADNAWAVGNLVGLCAGTHIYEGPGGNYPYHTIVPEDNWTVKVIDGPRYFDGQAWWDTSRFAAGDPSGGTGWVKQSEADSCFNGGGPGGSDGGGTGTDDNMYSNPYNDTVSDAAPLQANQAPTPASDGFQWPFSQNLDAGKNATGFYFGQKDKYCPDPINGMHDGVDYDAGNSNFVYSIGEGKVIKVGWDQPATNSGFGLYIVIWHITPNGENVYSLYAHLEKGTALVKTGQPVERGQKIARQDTTGGANNVSHLHFELRKPNPKYTVGTESSIFGYSSCPTITTDLTDHFYDPITYIPDYWWEKYPSQQPTPETLKQDVSALANSIGTLTYIEQATINQGQISAPKSFWVNSWDVILTIWHKIFGSATEISIYKPDGTLYGTYLVDGPHSLGVIIQNPQPGQWSYTIRGVNIPYADYPYAVSVGTRTEPFLDLGDTLGDTLINTVDGDLIAPTTTLILSPTLPNGENGWYKTPVQVSFTAVDNSGGVGVAETRYEINNNHQYVLYSGPFTLSTEGVNTIRYYSTDGMGNPELMQTAQIKIDLTPPVVTVTTDQQQYTRVQPFVVHYSGYDPEPGSGLATLTGMFNGQNVANNQSIDMFWWDLGQYTLTATGEDYAGWVTTQSQSVQLVATIESLQQTVRRLCEENYIAKSGICSSLLRKLNSALVAQQRGQNKTAVNILLAFQNEIRAQTDKSIMPEAKAILVMDSNYIITSLGGKVSNK